MSQFGWVSQTKLLRRYLGKVEVPSRTNFSLCVLPIINCLQRSRSDSKISCLTLDLHWAQNSEPWKLTLCGVLPVTVLKYVNDRQSEIFLKIENWKNVLSSKKSFKRLSMPWFQKELSKTCKPSAMISLERWLALIRITSCWQITTR